MQFVDGLWMDSYYPTIENTFSKVIKVKGQEYATEIVDMAGQVSITHAHLHLPTILNGRLKPLDGR